jgi:hypothetical protein
VFEHDPAFTISAYIGRGGHIGRGGQSNTKLLIEGLRKEGCSNEPGALVQTRSRNGRFWHETDMPTLLRNVRS